MKEPVEGGIVTIILALESKVVIYNKIMHTYCFKTDI